MKNEHLLVGLAISLMTLSCSQSASSDIPVFTASYISNLKASDYFEKMEYLILDDGEGALFVEPHDIEYFEDKWYILDKNLMSVLCFNKDGSFHFRIQSVGRGPGEYQLPQSLTIHPERKELWIECRKTARILKYDLDGRFIEDISIGRAGYDLLRFNTDHVLAYDADYHYRSEKDSIYPGLFFLDKKFSPGKQIYAIKHDILLNEMITDHCLSLHQDTCYFLSASDSLLTISQDLKVQVAGVFDFGKYHLPESLHNLPRLYKNYDQLIPTDKVLWKDRLVPADDFMFMTIGLQNSYWYGVIDRKTNQLNISQGFSNDLESRPFAFPIAHKSANELVGFLSAEYIMAMKESLAGIDSKDISQSVRELQNFVDDALKKSGNVLVTMTLKK